jgi:WD40 repeat protein
MQKFFLPVFFISVSLNLMTSINQLEPLGFPKHVLIETIGISCDGKYMAVIFRQNRSVIDIFTTKDACHVSTVHVPGYEKAAYVPASLHVAFAWSTTEDGPNNNLLVVVSSMGHLFQSRAGSFESIIVKNFNPRNATSRSFSKIACHRDVTVIASDRELIAFSPFENKTVIIPFITESCTVDQVLSMDIHPSSCFVSLCMRERKSLLIVALNNSRTELTAQLSRLPKEVEVENDFQTPAEPDEEIGSFPRIVNEIFLTGSNRLPIACAWSKYGDNLVVASSDSLLTIWNVPSSTLTTVSLDDDVVIRNVKFINDSLVAVAINNANRILFVDVDEGISYETPDKQKNCNSKSICIDFSLSKAGTDVYIFRPSASALNRWHLAL